MERFHHCTEIAQGLFASRLVMGEIFDLGRLLDSGDVFGRSVSTTVQIIFIQGEEYFGFHCQK